MDRRSKRNIIYTSNPSTTKSPADQLAISSGYLFWRENGVVKRLPTNAAALPLTNMRITGIEVTQGIQKPDNSVVLVQNRRTFVRMFVQSDGPSMPGVTILRTASEQTSQCRKRRNAPTSTIASCLNCPGVGSTAGRCKCERCSTHITRRRRRATPTTCGRPSR